MSVPPVIELMTAYEVQTISICIVLVRVFTIDSFTKQFNSNVINIKQDLESFCQELPRLPAECRIAVRRKKGEKQIKCKDFYVRKTVIEHGLTWYIINNKKYKNIKFNR